MTSIMKSASSTDRINDALATLKKKMVDLRQQDVHLMKQLISINDTIQKLSKQRPGLHGPVKKKFAILNGRRVFVNHNESIPEETPLVRQQSVPNYCSMNGSLSGSLSSIEDTCGSMEDLSSADSDSDDSLFGYEQNLSDSFSSATSRSRSVANASAHVTKDSNTEYYSYEQILRRNIKLWKFARSQQH
ncbi:uncharacterized protein LOC110447665 [Mizuhopecten yessoensis]|uniref:uncharacterized protein LOC110447665 n=1 Tax=Mizuhopecten yessoensis TaxID=6573 RepID=UPI000B45A2FC|nr:uncharacterized protein LOC110447665 [Mizuhopecten yessoensis]